jgi:tetratricopeptide (TPR) repeat protein
MWIRFQIILLSIINISLYSQYSNDSLLSFADVQYNSGNYRLAVKEYQRVIFYSENAQPDVLLRLANAQFYCNNWNEARNYYDQVYRLTSSDSIKLDARLRKISSFIAETKYNEALIDLFNINDSLYKTNSFDIDVFFGICYFGLDDFETSKQYFISAAGNNPKAVQKIDSIFSDKKLLARPKPSTAYVLSIILPGLGQLYSGHIQEGLNSFFLTESILVVAVLVASQYSFVDAMLMIVPWYQRYYMGGANKAKLLANEKLLQNRSQAYKNVLDILQETQSK